ncbi:hypothetical protein ISS40_00765 [Candidatus Bathyarchaeota archaeon]|nr:hypothetical protein [Candidatus Bathyarchaeota archaeon]
MSLLEWLGGVKKSLYEESQKRCKTLEEKAGLQERLLSDLKTENSKLRGTSNEALEKCRSMQAQLDTQNKAVS